MSDKLYAKRDPESQGEFYQRHLSAMTAEGLHEKSDIAYELAHRDQVIAALLDACKDSLKWVGGNRTMCFSETQTELAAMLEAAIALAEQPSCTE